MTNAEKIRLQEWWLEELRDITRRTMRIEEKRIERLKKRGITDEDLFGDEFYRTQIDLLQNEYEKAKQTISDLQKEDKQ